MQSDKVSGTDTGKTVDATELYVVDAENSTAVCRFERGPKNNVSLSGKATAQYKHCSNVYTV